MDLKDIRLYVDDRPAEGVFRVHRDVYSDPELFELEQKFIFERAWNFLGLESQMRKPNDFLTAHIGRTPVLAMRDAKGRLGAFVNVCRHKGALLCSAEEGNSKYHVCPYHGWAYDASGKNVDIKDSKTACYPASFEAEDHNLVPLARVASYRGFVFGSLSAEVPPLEEFLGDMRFFIDLVADQGPNGMQFIPGRSVYTYRGNWKLQLDNGLDPYHLTTTHLSYMDLQARRRGGEGHLEARQYDWAKRNEFLLSLGIALDGRPGIHALAGDTDGVDGLEEIAGAYLAPDTLERAWARGIKPKESLADNDGHGFFEALGDSVVTGPTLTNVNDFRAVLITQGARS